MFNLIEKELKKMENTSINLRLSKFRKIVKLVSSKNLLKVSIKEELYNIIQINDREDTLIFVVDLKTN